MTEFFLTGAALGLAAGISPGPILALVVAQTLRYGRREGITVAFAPLLSDLPIVALSLLILSRLQNLTPLMAAISLTGAAFLTLLAIESFRAKPLSASASDGPPRSLTKAVVLNFLNAHVYLFWTSVGAPIILRGSASGPAAPAAFLASFYLCLVGSKIVVAVLLGRVRGLLTGRAYVYTLQVLSVILLGLAALLLRDGLARLGFVWSL